MRETNNKIKSISRIILIFFCLLSLSIGCGEIKSEKAVETLIRALRDKDDDVRKEAAKALGEIYSKVRK